MHTRIDIILLLLQLTPAGLIERPLLVPVIAREPLFDMKGFLLPFANRELIESCLKCRHLAF
jgi:hypothetical protein